MPLRALDFESSASANSATPAGLESVAYELHVVALWQGDVMVLSLRAVSWNSCLLRIL